MNTDSAIVRAYAEAVIRMLVGDGPTREGLSICAGAPLDNTAIATFARAAQASGMDVVYLTIAQALAGHDISDIHVFAPRDACCYVFPGCRFWLAEDGCEAAIVPPDNVRGHFVVDACDIVHLDGKPRDMVKGAQRADRKLKTLIASPAILAGTVNWHVGMV